MREKQLNGRCNVKPIRKYLKRYGLSQSEFARRIGKKQSTVSQWLRTEEPMPVSAATAKRIEEVTAGEVKRTDILPELFAA